MASSSTGGSRRCSCTSITLDDWLSCPEADLTLPGFKSVYLAHPSFSPCFQVESLAKPWYVCPYTPQSMKTLMVVLEFGGVKFTLSAGVSRLLAEIMAAHASASQFVFRLGQSSFGSWILKQALHRGNANRHGPLWATPQFLQCPSSLK